MSYFVKKCKILKKKYSMVQEDLANKLGYKSFTTIQNRKIIVMKFL